VGLPWPVLVGCGSRLCSNFRASKQQCSLQKCVGNNATTSPIEANVRAQSTLARHTNFVRHLLRQGLTAEEAREFLVELDGVASHLLSLELIRLEDVARRLFLDHRSNLPRQVECVHHADAHTLTSLWRVGVACVAGDRRGCRFESSHTYTGQSRIPSTYRFQFS
jgi:hypothetical protein